MLIVNYGDDVILAVTTASEPKKRYLLDIFPFCMKLLVKRSVQDLKKKNTIPVCRELEPSPP